SGTPKYRNRQTSRAPQTIPRLTWRADVPSFRGTSGPRRTPAISTAKPEQNKQAPRPKNGQVLDVTFDSLAYGGEAVGRVDGFVIFTKYAAPGDRARVRIRKSKKTYAQAELL